MALVKKFRERNKSFFAHVMYQLSLVTFSLVFSHVHYQLQRKEHQYDSMRMKRQDGICVNWQFFFDRDGLNISTDIPRMIVFILFC